MSAKKQLILMKPAPVIDLLNRGGAASNAQNVKVFTPLISPQMKIIKINKPAFNMSK